MVETKQRIEDYASLLGVIQNRVGDSEAALVILEQISKDRRMAQIVEERNGNSKAANGEQPATAKQLGYIRQLGGKPRENMTKQEASAMIDELAGQNGF